jgi:hypothetical protein
MDKTIFYLFYKIQNFLWLVAYLLFQNIFIFPGGDKSSLLKKKCCILIRIKMIYKFPLKENSKIPAIKNWKETDYTEMTEKRTCNYGVVCGIKSSVMVVDYDCYKENVSFTITLDSLRGVHGECAYIVTTPSGGFHVYHKYSTGKFGHWKNLTGINGCIDIRTEGGVRRWCW